MLDLTAPKKGKIHLVPSKKQFQWQHIFQGSLKSKSSQYQIKKQNQKNFSSCKFMTNTRTPDAFFSFFFRFGHLAIAIVVALVFWSVGPYVMCSALILDIFRLPGSWIATSTILQFCNSFSEDLPPHRLQLQPARTLSPHSSGSALNAAGNWLSTMLQLVAASPRQFFFFF